ncbi:hypothetical protein GTP44_23920 [Duganella sp. FT50W]|uniref:Uncharacterized protein n=1 Tax=Duganella lactea TaxID=2692173 RepID=A0A6L8MSD0_9BURK|nr:hypothetical protein [Duganella lactea]MYM84981.1 hypothetical protein [Duganella lactea]
MEQIIIVGHPDPSDPIYNNNYDPGAAPSGNHERHEHDEGPRHYNTEPDDIGGPGVFFPTTEARTVHITSTAHASVRFDPNADRLVTQSLLTGFNSIIDSVNNITSINISATTNGHDAKSNHGVGNAVDINYANGVHIGTTGEGLALATVLENAAKANDNIRFVEGPMGNFVRTTPGGEWRPSGDLGPSQNTHVHFEVFPKR